MTPPEACIGSPTKAPMLSAPIARHRLAELVDQEIGERLDAHACRPAERIGRRQLDDQIVGARPSSRGRAAGR